MKTLRRMLPIVALSMLTFIGCKKTASWELSSPNGNIKVAIFQDKDSANVNRLYYSVNYKNNTVLKKSPLGIICDKQSFVNNLVVDTVSKIKAIDESYTMLTGKKKQCVNKANEFTISFKNEDGASIAVIFRAYNDGIAFRYRFAGNDTAACIVKEELTGFAVPEGKAWIAPYDKPTQYSPAYETFYSNEIPVGQKAPGAEGWAFPALFHISGAWMLLTESNLDGSYCAVHLQPDVPGGMYSIRFPESAENEGVGSDIVHAKLPLITPWRLAIIGESLGTIIESTLVTDLADPCILKETNWIKPGRSSWSWWGDPASPKVYGSLVKFIDFSKDMGWEYSLIDANWNIMQGGNIEQLVKYSNQQGVGTLLWYNSGGNHNVVTEQPRDLMLDKTKRRKEFQRLQSWGVKGIKVDFFQSDKQTRIQQYIDILKDAADFKIMVNFHGCTLPTGWARTYPNNIGMEAVKGAECYGFQKDYPETAPWHNTILACTRNVVGSMDYTPVTFGDGKFPHLTSWAHELALSVLFENGILHLADRVETYKALPEVVKEYLKQVPVVWDEIKYVYGYPGKEIVIARRAGNTWFVAGINGEIGVKDLKLDLRVLGKGFKDYQLFADGKDAKSFDYSTGRLKNKKIEIKMASRGGFVIVLKKKE
jgi:alpha-glucosidase